MADDVVQQFMASYGQHQLSANLSTPPALRCCCADSSCVYLEHNQAVLHDLEGDVRQAAKLGSALLTRHEAYIADSDRERKAMMMQIDSLETEKQVLERENASVIEDNRNLLNQLEALNAESTESDAHVTSLQTTLLSAQQELQKLSHLAGRAARLEQELADYEQQQSQWQESLEAKNESEKVAVRRWQHSERTLVALQEQLESIEQESNAEKERHAEVVARMQRRHAVESELNSAAGRLKGAAATKTASREGGAPSVVSHFVKDILQDNANLQMGIVELREMLQTSNDEVEALRNRLLDHGPDDDLEAPLHDRHTQGAAGHKDLREEMHRTTSQELHVHHHYHAPPVNPSKAAPPRRVKKKRYGSLASGYSSGYSTPRSSVSLGTPSSMATILQQTAVSVPRQIPNHRKRMSTLSTMSSQTYHSLPGTPGPSSPQSSTNRTSSMYDRVFSDVGYESSRPTTPDTDEPGSPVFAPTHMKRGSFGSFRTRSAPVVQRGGINPSVNRLVLGPILDASFEQLPEVEGMSEHEAIPEDKEDGWEASSSPALERSVHEKNDSVPTSRLMDDELDHQFGGVDIYKPSLRRAASHESLLSVSGMDIHTLQSRPSQLLTPYGRSFSSQASVTGAHAHGMHAATFSRPTDTGHSLLRGMAADQRQQDRPTLSKKASGWIFGRWGASPAPTVAVVDSMQSNNLDRPPSVLSSTPSSERAADDPQSTPKQPKLRMPGINQAGPIPGFGPEARVVHPPIVRKLDEEALKNALAK